MSEFHDILGRVGGIAVIDVVGTVIISAGVAKACKWNVGKTIIGGFLVGELTHLALGKKTPITSLFMAEK